MNDSNRICGFCYQTPDHGKLLYCQHIFCLNCLKNQLLVHYDSKVRKNGIICLLCSTFTPLKVKIEKKFTLNPIHRSSSKRLYLVKNLDALLPDVCQPTYEDLNPSSSKKVSTSSDPENPYSAGYAADAVSMTLFHREFLNQSASAHYPCQCSISRNWKCVTCNETFCDSCCSSHWEKLLPNGLNHDIFNQYQCIYCLGTKTWYCLSCDRPLCTKCLQVHLDQFDNHEVVDVAEQNRAASQFQNGASSSTDLLRDMAATASHFQINSAATVSDFQINSAASAPVYYSSAETKNTTVERRDLVQIPDVKPKYGSEPLVPGTEDVKQNLHTGDEDYRPPAYYERLHNNLEIFTFDSKLPPPIPMRPPTKRRSTEQQANYPPEVKLILQLTEPNVPKKFCVDSGGQIFMTFEENDREIFKFDRNSGQKLSTIDNETTVVDMDYNEKNDTLLVLSKTDNGDNFFLQKYNVFNSQLIDIFDLGSEDVCSLVVADKKNHHRAFVTMRNKIKVFNFVNRSFERTVLLCTSAMPDTNTLLSIEANEKGSLYLLFGATVNDCTVFAFHTIPVPVEVPLQLTNGMKDIAIGKNNILCFSDPQSRRILLFTKGPTKEYVHIWDEICETNKYAWKPQLLAICDDELLILDVESKTLYSWTIRAVNHAN